jgi:hypothetical protein
MAVITNNPTFNKSNQNSPISVGYYSRTIFSCGGNGIANQNLYGETGIIGSNDNGIQYLIDNYSNECHGYNEFPAYYWKAGKSVRIKGNCLVMGYPGEEAGQYTQFNMSVGLKESSDGGVAILANSAVNSIFPLTGGDLCPVDFEYIITCATPDTYSSTCCFFASGYYQYNYGQYNSSGTNTNSTVYTPVFGNPGSIGISSISTAYTQNSTKILFNFYDSTIYYLYLTSLTLEELS